jgi:hypothetical protein
MQTLKQRSFYNLTYLTEVAIDMSYDYPEKYELEIMTESFYADNIKKLSLPLNTSIIHTAAFTNNSKDMILNNYRENKPFIFPDSLKRIEDNAFGSARLSLSLLLPVGMEYLGKNLTGAVREINIGQTQEGVGHVLTHTETFIFLPMETKVDSISTFTNMDYIINDSESREVRILMFKLSHKVSLEYAQKKYSNIKEWGSSTYCNYFVGSTPQAKITVSGNKYDLTNQKQFWYYTSEEYAINSIVSKDAENIEESILESGVWVDASRDEYYLYVATALPTEGIYERIYIDFLWKNGFQVYTGPKTLTIASECVT